MSCVLRAGGELFDVDLYLSSSTLTACAIFHKGEPQSSLPGVKVRLSEKSGINVDVSDKDFADLDGQITDAMAFLRSNLAELQRLAVFPGVDGVLIDFAVEAKDTFTQSYIFPAELLKLAGDLGISIEVSLYPESL